MAIDVSNRDRTRANRPQGDIALIPLEGDSVGLPGLSIEHAFNPKRIIMSDKVSDLNIVFSISWLI
jgi:hypothetical protein